VVGKQVSANDRERIQAWLDDSVHARDIAYAVLDAGSLTTAKEMFGEAAGRLRDLSSMLRK
jgi:hypothetical protein